MTAYGFVWGALAGACTSVCLVSVHACRRYLRTCRAVALQLTADHGGCPSCGHKLTDHGRPQNGGPRAGLTCPVGGCRCTVTPAWAIFPGHQRADW